MPSRKITPEQQTKCYMQYLACNSKKERTELLSKLAGRYKCHSATIYRAITTEHGGPLNQDPPQRPTRGPTYSGRAPRKPIRYRDASPEPQVRGARATSPSPRLRASPIRGIKPNLPSTNGVDVRQFLTYIGLERLVNVFEEHGFATRDDLEKLRAFPERTQNLILQALREDRRVNLKDWGIFHAALSNSI